MQHGTTSIFPTLSSSTIPMIRAAAETTEKMMAEPNSPCARASSGRTLFQYGDGRWTDSRKYQRSRSRRIYSVAGRNSLYQTLGCRTGTSGAMQFGKYITAKGVLASVGHTQAEFEDIQTAYEAGYTHATHFIMQCRDSINGKSTSMKVR